jgi:hypothetical protein
MHMDPVETRFLVNERIGNISRQVKHEHLAQKVKTMEQGQVGRFSGWLLLARLRNSVGFGNGQVVQGPEVDRVVSRPELVKPLKPEEQCC